MSLTRMTTLAFILSGLFPLDGFICNFVSAPKLENHLEYNHDTSQLCRTGHDNGSRTRMTTLAFILYELYPLDCFSCNFELCRTGHDNASNTKMATLVGILSELFPLDGFRCNFMSTL